MSLTPAEQIQNRYIRLGDALAELSCEAADLEEAMSGHKIYPMSLGVYEGITRAHEAVVYSLGSISQHTGVPVNQVTKEQR